MSNSIDDRFTIMANPREFYTFEDNSLKGRFLKGSPLGANEASTQGLQNVV